MKTSNKIFACGFVALIGVTTDFANAQGGRRNGGGHPSVGRVGAGAGRTSQVPNSIQNRVPQRPNVPQPSQRPSLGNTRPGNLPLAKPSMPGAGSFNPSGGRPGVSVPSVRPGNGVNPPSLGNVNRPSTLPGNVTRPGSGLNPPNLSNTNRPTTLPGKIERSNLGNNNNISIGNVNIGNTGSVGGGIGNVLGGRGGNFATTLPAWDRPSSNKPGWGIGYPGQGQWNDNWHHHCIHHHHGWYHGCWNHGCWGGGWYRPTAWIVVGWGLHSMSDRWGYGVGYYNPYYVVPTGVVAIDYSQPVFINNYQTMEETSITASNMRLENFDQGLAQFKSGNYEPALIFFDSATQENPGDAVVHEVRALTLFATKQYVPAAAALNSFLSSGPGMDWTTMSSLYGNLDDYSQQLAALEKHVQENANDAAAFFVLSYHYLVQGEQDQAVRVLTDLTRLQPRDSTSKRMLDALSSPTDRKLSTSTLVTNSPDDETNLVGNWKATTGDTTIELKIESDSSFQWKAISPGKPLVELAGQLSADQDAIVLVNEQAGSIAGNVVSLGVDQWQFLLEGAPAGDARIVFSRTKVNQP
jgi:tetratricopeptide (TPR) repeat protein